MAAVRERALLLSYQADGTAVGSWFMDGDWADPFRVDLPASAGCPAQDIPTLRLGPRGCGRYTRRPRHIRVG